MKSVSAYPEYAGDSKNIQFLTRQEHIEGAHKGSTRNPTNGYYNPVTKRMSNFGDNAPRKTKIIELSKPLSLRQQSNAINKEKIRLQAAKEAKALKAQAEQSKQGSNARRYKNVGIDEYKRLSEIKNNNSSQSGKTENRGIQEFREKTQSESCDQGKKNKGLSEFVSKSKVNSTNSKSNNSVSSRVAEKSKTSSKGQS
jgi:hypothetical protein